MKRRATLALVALGALAAAALAGQGPFVNEDYEKIALNSDFLIKGPVWKKALEGEAGSERGYYRPVSNVLLASMARVFGVKDAPPFRTAGALIFFAAIAAIFFAARRLTGSARLGAVAAAIWAAHPFVSWLWFQASWMGNSLVIVFLAAAWHAWASASAVPGPRRTVVLALFVFLAALSKDSGILFPLMAAPLLAAAGPDERKRALRLWGASALAAAFFLALRAVIVGTHEFWQADRWTAVLSNAAVIWGRYFAAAAVSEARNYAVPLAPFGGWPLSAAAFLTIVAGLWLLRKDRVSFVLAWCAFVSSFEMFAGAALSFELVGPRGILCLAFLTLLAARLWSRRVATLPAPARLAVIVLAAVFFAHSAWASAAHMAASYSQTRFYDFHNSKPYNWKTLFTEARFATERGEFERARILYGKSLRISDRSITRNNLALVLWKLNRREDSIAEYRRALEMVPDDAETHYNLALSLQETGNYAGAILHYTQAAQLNPQNPQPYIALGGMIDGSRGAAEAIDAYGFALKILPENAMLRNNYGLALARANRDDDAIRELREAIRINPNYAIALNNLGMAMIKKRNIEEATGFFRRAVLAGGHYAKAHNNLGIAYARAGNLDDAILEFESAYDIDPKLPTVKENLEMARKQLAEIRAAEARP